ncbi:hypothetical protein CA13_66550 [Planctomycetes bacterium CA13]|uniref:DUF3592 domain-containing protein n=1 Tax=Novipirellula herctigrandis TaxID=2527986 RepID=A0A5C5ZF43_9BACT|nr:hypothetical protein CA13_66550 [Planctomycetes bacterium CA13]
MIVMLTAWTIVALGIAIASFAIVHERDWRKRLNNTILIDGLVTAELDDPEWENTRAEIEYQINGSSYRFVSNYGTGMLAVGDRVRVAVNTETGDAERLAFVTRWVFTFGPILLGGMFVLFGLLIIRQFGG